MGISEREEISSRAESEVKVKKENISQADLAHTQTGGFSDLSTFQVTGSKVS